MLLRKRRSPNPTIPLGSQQLAIWYSLRNLELASNKAGSTFEEYLEIQRELFGELGGIPNKVSPATRLRYMKRRLRELGITSDESEQ